jgi:hypothetical protein
MPHQKIRRAVLATIVAGVGLVCLLLAGPTFADTKAFAKNSSLIRQSLFVITDQEGYGTGECLEKESACGTIIADSFCESKGFKAAQFYRKAAADDVTGSIVSERTPPPRDPQAFIISCK